jgi:D-alanyl-D-alanine carboxypeptidase
LSLALVAAGTAAAADAGPPPPHRHHATRAALDAVVAAGRLSLDDSVEKWLPGLLDRNGYEPRRITIRQLLDHKSGVADVLANPAFTSNFIGPAFFAHRYRTWTPRELVLLGIANGPLFRPDKGWSYSNTNYSLAQMIIRRASGHGYAHEVRQRVLRPAGLHETVVPGTDPTLPRPHSRAYPHLFLESPDVPAYDVTRFNPTLAGAGGEMISTTHDLNRFFRLLLQGRLLPPRQQRELLHTVQTGRDYEYGLGIATLHLPCGTFWGNDGDVFGSVTYTYATRHGGHVVTLNTNDNWNDDDLAEDVLRAELALRPLKPVRVGCGRSRRGPAPTPRRPRPHRGRTPPRARSRRRSR